MAALEIALLNHQLEFIKDTETRFLGLVAGYGCLAGETLINGVPVSDMGTKPFRVETLHGSFWATPSYRKGKADLYQVSTLSGRSVTVTAQHRFLTPEGWRQLQDLRIGSIVAAHDNESDGEPSGKAKDSQANYSWGFHPCDGLPHPRVVDALSKLQQLRKTGGENNAQALHTLRCIDDFLTQPLHPLIVEGFLHPEELLESTRRTRRNLWQFLDKAHHSGSALSQDLLAQFELFRQHTSPYLDFDQAFHGLLDQRCSYISLALRQCEDSCLPLCKHAGFLHTERQELLRVLDYFQSFSTPEKQHFLRSLVEQPYSCSYDRSPNSQEPLNAALSDELSYSISEVSSCNNYSSFWDKVTNISFVRHDDFYDLHVPFANHYSAHGLWHHNSGKTRALILKTIDLAALNVGTDAGLFSATHELATDILLPEMDARLEEMKIRHTFKASPRPSYELHFPHGTTRILVRSFENWRRIVGNNYSFACVDEVDTLKPDLAKKSWEKLMGRIRVGKVNQIATTTTPEGFAFLYRFFVQNAGSDRRLIKATSLDNPFLPPEFIEDLKTNYSAELVKAYLYGEFVNLTSGSVYHTFDRILNNCDDVPLPGETLHIGMDFNISKMAAVVHVIRDGLPRAVDEFMNLLDTPAMIAAIKARYSNHPINIYPDASGNNRDTADASNSDLALLRKAGFSVVVNAANPAVKDRINAMNAAFCNADGDRRYLVNVKRCPVYVQCLEQQAWKDGQPDKSSGFDHGADCGGYFIVKFMPIRSGTSFSQSSAFYY